MKRLTTGILPALGTLGLLLTACSSSEGGAEDCQVDEDCIAGFYCRQGECVFDCTRDSDCPEGFRCTARGRCERGCTLTNGGVEACDDVDNDCDGETDEGFEQEGTACDNQGCPGSWVCSADQSELVCDAPAPAADDATCDGRDDDCDDETDEDAGVRLCALQEGVCAGAEQACLPGGQWSDCDYGPAYVPGEDSLCDKLDNDCDGETDEEAPILLEPEADATDGLDDNCNGLVDERGSAMVPVPGEEGVWIDAFEAAVFDAPDCTGTQYGVTADDYPAGFPPEGDATVTLYACAVPDILPSGHLSWYRARRACEAQGKRLCQDAEWASTCASGTINRYPYGNFFASGSCNDAWRHAGGPPGELAPTGSYPDCAGESLARDMSGNLAEWLQNWDEDHTHCALVAGGSYVCEICSRGLNCLPCDPLDDDDWSDLMDILDCLPASRSFDVFPREMALSYLGTRCCMDGP
jgi:hypothetical protein